MAKRFPVQIQSKDSSKRKEQKPLKEFAAKAEGFTRVDELKGKFSEVEKMKKMPNQYKGQMEQLQDSAYIKGQVKKKAEELAMKYVNANPEVLEGVYREN